MMLAVSPALCQEIREEAPASLSESSEGEKEEDFGHRESIFFNGGFHTEFFDAVQTDSSGSMRKIQFRPTLGVGLAFPLSQSWRFLPEINWVLPQLIDESNIIKNVVMLRADFGYNLLDWLRLRVGTSVMWLNQHGRGGKAKMKNGNETTDFYYPNENRSSLNNTLDFGAEVLNGDWAFRLQTYTYALFKEERRQVSYTLFVTYYWKE